MPRERAQSRTKRRRPAQQRAPRERPHEPAGAHREGRWLLPLLLLAVLALPALVFARTLTHDFVLWDDTIEVYKNPYLNPVTWQSVAQFWRRPYINLYVPVSYTAFALLARFARLPAPDPALGETGALLNPHVFHAANWSLHLLNALLVFAILRLLTRRAVAAPAGALVFALHPVQVESVAWVSELRSVLCGSCSLACIWLYLRRARSGAPRDPGSPRGPGEPGERRRPPGRSGAWLYSAALLAGALAMLAKPSAVSLPLVLVALDRWCLRRPWRACLAGVAPLLALAVPAVLLTQGAQPVRSEIVAPVWQRPFVAGDALAFYLQKLALPLDLAIDYGRTPARVLSSGWGYAAWLIPATAALLLWRLARRASWLAAAGAVSLAALLPVLGLVPFAFQFYSTVADRYLYLALLGPALAVACLLSRSDQQGVPRQATTGAAADQQGEPSGESPPGNAGRPPWPSGGRMATLAVRRPRQATGGAAARSAAAWAVVAALLAGWAVASYVQSGTWRNSVTLLTHAIAVNPASDVSFANRGMALARRGQLDRAEMDFREALRINPGNYKAHSNLGNALLLRGRREAAMAEYRTAIAIEPAWAESHSNLGMALAMRGELDEAAAQFREALRLDPGSASARSGLAQALRLLGRPRPPA